MAADLIKVHKDDWLKKLAEVAAADTERIKKGEEPVLTKHAGPFFDVMDEDKDGFLTLRRFCRRICGCWL